MDESGQLDRMWSKWIGKMKKNYQVKKLGHEAIGMLDVFVLFVFLSGAMALSLLLAQLERLKNGRKII